MAAVVAGVWVASTTKDGVSTPVGAGDGVPVMAVGVVGVSVDPTMSDGVSVSAEVPGDGPVTADVAAGVSVNPTIGDGVSVSADDPGGVPLGACRLDASPTEGSDDAVAAGLIVCAGVPAPVPAGDGDNAPVGAALGDGLPVMVVAPTGVPVRDAGISSKLNTPITHTSTPMIRRKSAIHRPIGTTVSPLA
jgi:hypothetical protein